LKVYLNSNDPALKKPVKRPLSELFKVSAPPPAELGNNPGPGSTCRRAITLVETSPDARQQELTKIDAEKALNQPHMNDIYRNYYK
jgi:hypothetical protein